MKVYIKKHSFNAGKWIYEGYKSAWDSMGYDSYFYKDLSEINKEEEYDLMAIDADIKEDNLDVIRNSRRSYVYVQPNKFPSPWGQHPNWITLCSDKIIDKLNNLGNVYQWCFGRVADYHYKWSNVHYIPLAYDSINYEYIEDVKYQFDVCFIGGWADNGFNEKQKIMINHFAQFKNCDIKCGLFVNRGVSPEIEMKILYNSKVAINIHDAYQRHLGFDSNERTFKALGLTGLLVSDHVREVKKLFPDVPVSSDPVEMKDIVLELLKLEPEEVNRIKQKNRLYIRNNHTYINRVEKLLEL